MSNSPLHKLPGSSSLNGLVQGNGVNQASSLLLNLAASVDPTSSDDTLEGYSVGSIWVNTSTNAFFICTNNTASNAIWSSGGGSGTSGTIFSVTATNSFSVGNVIRFDGTNYQLAQADNVTDAEVVGVVQTATSSQFTFVNSGFFMWTSHGFTSGKILFLSPTTAGGLISSDVSTVGQISKPVAIVLDANNLAILNYRGFSVGADNTAKNDKTYLTLNAEGATLSNSRQLAVSVPLTKTDAGAASTLTLGLDITSLTTGTVFSDTDVWMQYNSNDTVTRKLTTDVLRNIMNGSARTDLASATSTDLGSITSDYIRITGTNNISSFASTARTGARKHLLFSTSLVLTYNSSSLILPSSASITTVAGDTCIAVHEGSGNWRVLEYQRISGSSLIDNGTPYNFQVFTSSGTFNPVTTSVYIILTGGGGGGGGSGSTPRGGGGGSAGAGVFLIKNLIIGTPITVTIGAAGAAGGTNASGGNGGTTSFGSYAVATGGLGGLANSSTSAGGNFGTISSYDTTNAIPLFRITDMVGNVGTAANGSVGGGGAVGYFTNTGSNANVAGTKGGGGGGATSGSGGAGGSGYLQVMW